jgi:type II secretory pathway component PulF
VTLNREIAGLVRAGIPLELGLGGLSASVPRRLGRLTDRLAERLRGGESLASALDREGGLPPLYHAVVRAGLRSGRLPAALEALSAYARSLIDLRRRIVVAMIYPAIVLAVGYVLFAFFVEHVVASMLQTQELFDLPRHAWLTSLADISRFIARWGWIVPAVILALVAWSAVSGGLLARRAAIGGRLLAIVPGIGGLNRNFRTATFADLLALLLEHGVPLDESLQLAAAASGSSRLAAEAGDLAASVRSGSTLASGLEHFAALPSLARWMIAAGERQGGLAATLRQVAQLYRRRAQRQADWMKVVLPVVAVILVGGGTVLLYALALFVPLTGLLRDLVV